MKISLAQTEPIRGDTTTNIVEHIRWIETAGEQGASAIIFPELSLTGYEPSLAEQLAMSAEDRRLDVFQELCARYRIIIALGAPIRFREAIAIGMPIFQPGGSRQVYYKHYLHADELPFFVPGPSFDGTIGDGTIRMAICYELSVKEHAAAAMAGEGGIYIASVAKSAQGADNAQATLSTIARQYNCITCMVNSIGPADDFVGGGLSSVWDSSGNLMGQLGRDHAGLLIVDTETGAVTRHVIPTISA